ncbi:MAG: flagellar biosynthetic protein FliQ [Rhodospirillales bacterium]
MTAADAGALMAETMAIVVKLGGPPLLAALVVGVIVALFQAVTQINEATFSFIPKLLALGVTMLLLGSFMFATLTSYTLLLFDRIVAIGAS